MENTIVGINEEELSNLSLEVIDYADRISEIFDKLDNCMERLSSCYQGDSERKLLNYYQDLMASKVIIKDNILSYSDDFIELIHKLQENDKYLTTLFQNYTEDTINKVKSVMD